MFVKLRAIKDKNLFYSYFTPIIIFDIFWGIDCIEDFTSYWDSLHNDEKIKECFENIKDISDYLSESPNYSKKYIIWDNQKISIKPWEVRKKKPLLRNIFWHSPLAELKSGKEFLLCSCSLRCWKTGCNKPCNSFNVKLNDTLLTQCRENKRYYRSRIIHIEYDNEKTPENRYIKMAMVEFLPLEEQPIPKSLFQITTIDKIYYVSRCWSAYTTWGNRNMKRFNPPPNKIYSIPNIWVRIARRDAFLALALIY